MSLTVGQGNAVNALIDYVTGKAGHRGVITRDQALDALEQLLPGAYKTLGAGWSPRALGEWRDHEAHARPVDLYLEDDADDDPTVWMHDPQHPDAPIALLSRHRVVTGVDCTERQPLARTAAEHLWAHVVRGLPVEAPRTRATA